MRKHSSIKLALFVIFILSITQIHSFNTLATLKGACSQVNITPPVGTWLSGYSSRDKPSDDIADDLYAKVLVLNDGQTSIALISTDLLWIPLKMTNQIRKIIKENTGINEKNVLICGTHTHFGPKIDRPAKMWPDAENSRIDNAYVETLIKKIGGAVFIAHNSLQEVKIGAAKGEIPEIIYNRRPGKKDGSVQMSYTIPESEALPKPIIRVEEIGRQKITTVIPSRNSELTFGPIDPDVWILKVLSFPQVLPGPHHKAPLFQRPGIEQTIASDFFPYFQGQYVQPGSYRWEPWKKSDRVLTGLQGHPGLYLLKNYDDSYFNIK